MDSVLKEKFVQLKDLFNFQSDIKNILFYKKIKKIFNLSLLFLPSAILSFSLLKLLFNDMALQTWFEISFVFSFIPIFSACFEKLFLHFPPKFNLISYKLPSFLRLLPFIKSAEDSLLFSKEKIAKMLEDKNCQFVFYEFFKMAQNNLLIIKEQKKFTQNIILFKSFLESGNYTIASDYFIELYAVAHYFEYMVHDDYISPHDIEMLKTKKIILDEFLHKIDIEDFQENESPTKKIYLTKSINQKTTFNNDSKNKVNWKKLMDD